MTKITLENVAADCDDRSALYGLSSVAHLRHAALCGSAQAVIEAAKVVDDAAMRGLFAMSPVAETYFVALQEALAAHARNEQGTGP